MPPEWRDGLVPIILTTFARAGYLRLAGEGLSGAAIAERLHLSEGTVRNYFSEAIGKLGAGNRVEAARIARRQGWL